MGPTKLLVAAPVAELLKLISPVGNSVIALPDASAIRIEDPDEDKIASPIYIVLSDT